MTLRIAIAITAATAGVVGFASTSFASDDAASCCSSDKAAADTFIAIEKSADELYADFESVPEPDVDGMKYQQDEEYQKEVQGEIDAYIEAKTSAADAFVMAYPADDRAGPLMAQLMMMSEGDKQAKYADLLIEHHGDSPMAEQAKKTKEMAEKIGKPFELEFENAMTGDTISVQDDLQGKVVVVDFWATWCGPCIAEMPTMKKLYAEYKDQGVEFIGVSLDQPGDEEKLVSWVKDNGVEWPQYYQGNGWDSEFSKSWGINSIPAVFIVDANGNLHSTNARGKLEEMIPELIKKREEGASARAE